MNGLATRFSKMTTKKQTLHDFKNRSGLDLVIKPALSWLFGFLAYYVSVACESIGFKVIWEKAMNAIYKKQHFGHNYTQRIKGKKKRVEQIKSHPLHYTF